MAVELQPQRRLNTPLFRVLTEKQASDKKKRYTCRIWWHFLLAMTKGW
jgi:hypothetical protein